MEKLEGIKPEAVGLSDHEAPRDAFAYVSAVQPLSIPLAHSASTLVNELSAHPSTYLAMHADDPAAWQEWNQAVVEQAQREHKLIYISIGYFSCHWCPAMQRESYRDKGIARFLNQHFILVKVDRELGPALDARMIMKWLHGAPGFHGEGVAYPRRGIRGVVIGG